MSAEHFDRAGHAYKVVAVIEGERRETRARDYDHALELWNELGAGARNGNGVQRTWMERAPVGDWEVCSSELGLVFEKLRCSGLGSC